MSSPRKATTKQRGGSWKKNWASLFLLRGFPSSLRQNVLTGSSSGCIVAKLAELFHPTEPRSKPAHSFPRQSSMVGSQRDPKILRLDLSNVGKFIVKKVPAIAARSLKSDKLSPRQSAQSGALEFSCGAFRSLFAAMDAVTKHLRYDSISAKEVDLKSMRLFLRAPSCVDAANVRLRVRIWTSSHEAKLTEQSQQSTRQTCGTAAAKRIWRRKVPGTPFLIVFVSRQ